MHVKQLVSDHRAPPPSGATLNSTHNGTHQAIETTRPNELTNQQTRPITTPPGRVVNDDRPGAIFWWPCDRLARRLWIAKSRWPSWINSSSKFPAGDLLWCYSPRPTPSVDYLGLHYITLHQWWATPQKLTTKLPTESLNFFSLTNSLTKKQLV